MAEGLVSMSSQFKGLPMGDLIGGPLSAACDSQIKLADATANFIKVVGFLPPTAAELKADSNAVGDVRTAHFQFDRPVQDPNKTDANGNAVITHETVKMDVPLLSIVRVPNLAINSVDITFDMEVKSSTSHKDSEDKEAGFEGTAKVGWGIFSATVSVHGSVSAHQENTRSSDNSAKYHVEVHAADTGMPEGLARVLDIMQSASAPSAIIPANSDKQGKKAA